MPGCGRNAEGFNRATAEEVRFIRGLGKGRPSFVRRELLHGYLKSMKLRKSWDGINKQQARAVAEEEIAAIGRGR